MNRTFQITVPAPTPRAKRKRLSKEAYTAQRTLARTLIGYDNTSPIWGKTVPEVLDMIETEINAGNLANALDLITEYRKRIAQNRIAAVGSI